MSGIPKWPSRLPQTALLVLGLLLGPLPSDAVEPCLTEVPDWVTEALMHRTIGRLGFATQGRLLAQLAQRDDLDATQQALIAKYITISGPSPPPLEPMPAEPPVPASLSAIGLPLTDYRWYSARGRLDDTAICGELTPRTPADCPRGGDGIHNLVTDLLRTRYQLCGDPIVWQPDPVAYALVVEVAAILADPSYYGALESWLENDRDWSFRRPGNFFTLLYMDYLALAYEHGRINFALSEFLIRRRDLRNDYPVLDTLSRQLALLKELDLIE